MVSPGPTLTPPSVLVTVNAGIASTGVVVLSSLLVGSGSGPLLPSSAIETALRMSSTPAGIGSGMLTANDTPTGAAPAATSPATAKVQIEPALPSGTQLQPAV